MKRLLLALALLIVLTGIFVIQAQQNQTENNQLDGIGTALTYWTDGELLDGDYRGAYVDDHQNAVVIQFTVEDGVVTDTGFRSLTYDDVVYDTENPEIPEGSRWEDFAGEEGIQGIAEQYISAFEYLEGAESFEEIKEITKEMEGNPRENTDLYEYIDPAEVEGNEIDTFSAATIRSDKIGSAVRDAINRGKYR